MYVLLVTLVVSSALGRADAQSPPAAEATSRYTLSEWKAHQKCPDPSFFEQQLDEALGTAKATVDKEMQVSIVIKKRRGSFHLDLATVDSSGSGLRQLRAPNCRELLATAAIIVSLAMQPELLFQNESENEVVTIPFVQGQATDDEEPGAYSHSESRQSILQRHEDSSSSGLDVGIGLVAVADIGTLPRTALGAGVVASAQSRLYRLSFRLTQWAEQRRYVRSFDEGRGGNFDYLSATLDLCRDLWSVKMSVGVCGLLGLGRLNGESILIDLPISQTHIMAMAGVGAFLQVATGDNSLLRIQGELVAQFLRPNYNVEVLDENDDEVVVIRHIHKVSPASGRLAVSWGVQF